MARIFNVTLEFDSISAENPKEAALVVCKWLLKDEGASQMIYEVTDDETKEKVEVDLADIDK